MIQQTSLEAYESIKLDLNYKQQVVFDVIFSHQGMSNHDIARFLGWEINCVTPRVLELREMNCIEQEDIKIDRITKRRCMTWKVK